jgi:TonB family protein
VPIALVVLAMIAAGGFWYVHQYGAGSIRETAAKAISAVTGSAQSAGKQATAVPSTQVPTQVPAQVPAQTATQTQADQKQAGQTQAGQAQATPGAASATAAPSSESQQPAQGKNVQPSQPAGAQAAEAGGEGTESAAAANPIPPVAKEPATTGRAADRERTRETERGGVEKRVMPTVSEGARLGMRRPVEVLIRVSVNQKGSVSDASYVVPGPGNYFARAAQRAALSWKFKPRVQHGERERSVWMLRFNFGRGATEATATEQE